MGSANGHARKDAQAIILPYVFSVLGVFTFIIWGGETADTGAVQLAIAAWVVLGSLWTLLWFDGYLADVGAGMQDMDNEVASSNMGQNFAKAPFALFRGFNAFGDSDHGRATNFGSLRVTPLLLC
ncbi:MAG: hypothetical protein Ct9H300mP26_3090 [Acidimicrobiales bacterium]|nr:MAG: hypothetical protein Ct9H300mP26_3090 [Acidimicrobiales bacterium]